MILFLCGLNGKIKQIFIQNIVKKVIKAVFTLLECQIYNTEQKKTLLLYSIQTKQRMSLMDYIVCDKI